jgi:hypothetical protein
MEINDTERIDSSHPGRAKDGIAQANTPRRKAGRPTVAEVRGDPNIASKAAELRDLGRSWSEIASELGISRSSARRLVNVCQKALNSQIEEDTGSSVPEIGVSETCTRKEVDSSTSTDERDDGGTMALMPKSLKIFKKLLKKADEERSKRVKGL